MGVDMTDPILPRDERIEVRPDLSLRVLRWVPPRGAASEPPFLLVHGLASNARLWDGVGRRLANAGHVAVAVDQRGHGQSDKPDGGYDYDTVTGDLERLIETLRLERPIVAGQSWGAVVVLELAVRRPDLVGGMVSVDGSLRDMRDAFATWEACWERLAPPRLIGTPLTQIEGYFRTAHGDWPPEGIAGALANFEVRPDGTVAPWLTRERHERILRAMWAHEPTALWRRLDVPALLLLADSGEAAWTGDKRRGADEAARELAARHVPHRIVWLAADHDLHAQHPGEVVSLMLGEVERGVFSPWRETTPAVASNPLP